MLTATYSPEDNKLRLYSTEKLDPETYARVKAAGFIWAPKQALFVAPMWTPQREDLLFELCGEIGDEDTSLFERAEERAERFEDYSANRAEDAERAKDRVDSISGNIPFGQPILIGHHSEKRARKDAEKITNGMRKAVKMWEQAEYWKDRATGAIKHAKYKERPDVRARRIKDLEADKRKQEKYKAEAEMWLGRWQKVADDTKWKPKADGALSTIQERAAFLANYCHLAVIHRDGGSYWSAYDVLQPDEKRYKECPSWTVEQIQAKAEEVYPRQILHCGRWINHFENRLTYERAMLAASGGTLTDKKGPEKGGAVKCWASLNYGRGWSYILKVNKVTVTISNKVNYGDRIYTHNIPFDKIAAIMTAQEVTEAREAGRLLESDCKTGFFLAGIEPGTIKETPIQEPKEDKKAEIEAMKDAIREGVKVIVAPQLFPTPPEIAEKMVDLLEIEPGDRILEPSAGTGNLLGAMGGKMFGTGDKPYIERDQLHAVEINYNLAERLKTEYPLTKIHCTDFLSCGEEIGEFDRVIMNPPFENGVDIKHINHAVEMLKPGGRLVALCANGSRQRAAFKDMAEYWEDLPDGSFKAQGTGVNVALMVLKKEEVIQ